MQGNRDINGNNVTERVRNVTADISEMTGEQQFSREMTHLATIKKNKPKKKLGKGRNRKQGRMERCNI